MTEKIANLLAVYAPYAIGAGIACLLGAIAYLIGQSA